MRLFITGQAGFIGKHLSGTGVDDLSRGSGYTDYVCDVRDVDSVRRRLVGADVVVHLAAWKSVDESANSPLEYWDRNLVGTLRLLEAMRLEGLSRLVFASSAAVHGSSVYGQSKLAAERLIGSAPVRAAILRLQNVVGDGCSGLFPAIWSGRVRINGKNYPTRDGTCERDYIHVEDVADAIRASGAYLMNGGETFTCDIGTGMGTTVLEACEGVAVDYGPPRPGDVASSVADTKPARQRLGWTARRAVL